MSLQLDGTALRPPECHIACTVAKSHTPRIRTLSGSAKIILKSYKSKSKSNFEAFQIFLLSDSLWMLCPFTTHIYICICYLYFIYINSNLAPRNQRVPASIGKQKTCELLRWKTVNPKPPGFPFIFLYCYGPLPVIHGYIHGVIIP